MNSLSKRINQRVQSHSVYYSKKIKRKEKKRNNNNNNKIKIKILK
jgi:hypothetical protein